MITDKPATRPRNPCFSSGPCAKRPGWTLEGLANAALGRSHRSALGKAKLGEVIERSRALLGVPRDYRIGIVPASDTGAVELALWSLLGPRGVDVLAWESFGEAWAADISTQLRLDDVRLFEAPYGGLPDLSQASPDRDIVFAWNGTTSGVRVPDGKWIAASPRAVERLQTHRPKWPLPKIFRLIQDGRLNEGIFAGETINTPSMLAVEDHLDALKWAERLGGLPALIARSEANLAAIEAWVARTQWPAFLAADKPQRSCTSVCLKIVDPAVTPRKLAALLEAENVAFDIDAYRHAPPGLRIWAGATVETEDLRALFPWLDWAYAEVTA